MKLMLAIFGILLGVIVITSATPAHTSRHIIKKRSNDNLDEYYEKCDTYALIKRKRQILSPFFSTGQYPGNVNCKWSFIGDTNCFPEFICQKFDLRKLDDDCSSEYLKVSDGFGGEKVYCGKQIFDKPIRASQGAKDLFVEFRSAEDNNFPEKNAGFQCVARCTKNIENTEELPVVQKRKQDDRCVCGLQNKDDRIVGGEDAKMNEFPWQAAIVAPGTRRPICAGSVINDRFILTAAHCFGMGPPVGPSNIEILIHAHLLDHTFIGSNQNTVEGTKGSIVASGWNLSKVTDEQEGTQRFKVTEIINHPLFANDFDYDVALLRLDRKIDLSAADAPTPICIPGAGQYDDGFEDDEATVIGWGKGAEAAGATTRILQKLKVPILNLKVCESWMTASLTQRMLCAGYELGERDACQGDSGGPLALAQANKQWMQIGVVSWGEGCARRRRPGFYSRMTELTQWVNHHTLAANSVWCKDTK